ncbi:MAG: methionine ABC transporter permease [Actinomycetaceae bacterium]|nr:methionine ABC transporter permease [Actinomycetaceae bacterium]
MTPEILADGTWFNHPAIQNDLLSATTETLLMVSIATAVAIVFGGLLGVILTATRNGGVLPSLAVNVVIDFVVNVGRSIPFVIFMFLLIPFARFLVNTGTGWLGATVPLAVAAIPYFARLVESNLDGVDHGKVEASQMMGASRSRILAGVLVREALPALIQSATILIITLISYSAMAGLIGGGGLGSLAQTYGYYNNDWDVVIIIVVVIVAMVQIVQWVGNMLSRLVDHR